MRAYTQFKEYIWLINTIAKAGRITLEEINRKWIDTEMSQGVELSRRTFIRHKDEVEDIFGIIIACDKRDRFRYYIENVQVLRQQTIQNWMLSTLSVNNIVGDGLSLQNRIIIESVPVDDDYLSVIIKAMKSKRRLAISYHKYGESMAKEALIEPCCLKMFKQRWYVVGRCEDGAYKIYSLDRIVSISLGDGKYTVDKSFDAHAFFDEYYGILRMESCECENVVIRAFGKERYYMRDLPMHHSQVEISSCDDYADFKLRLRPTPDFCTHLLSRASQIKVLEPEWLQSKIKEMALSVASMY